MADSIWDRLPEDFQQRIDEGNRTSALMDSLHHGTEPPPWTQIAAPDPQTSVCRMLSFLYGQRIDVETAELYVPILLEMLYGSRWRPAEVLLQATVVRLGDNVQDGQLIDAVALPWFQILREIERNPDFLYHFSKYPRRFEEFIAGAYERAGWPEVILTPRSGDGGRDVIATKPGFGSIRFLEQCKAYSPGTLVTHDDVRGMLGVLQTDRNASKAIITATSDFQPGIGTSSEFTPFMPHRLELRNGKKLAEWLLSLRPHCQ